MAEFIGKTIAGRYQVTSFLGKGGISEVYKVWDNIRSVNLAMKVLHADLAEDKVFLRRFQREARALSKLQHPNIVRFYGLEQSENLVFMLMELIEGTTLRQEIFNAQSTFSNERILEIMRPICAALYYAHELGVVHVDIKPANIMIDKRGNAYISDFGLAYLTESATMTLVGASTPVYMSPEQIRGENPTRQSDIYALGIVLFEMLTDGERPFTGERAQADGTTSEKVRWEKMRLSPPPPSTFNLRITTSIDNIVLKCLEESPSKRYSSTLELLSDLDRQLKLGNFEDEAYAEYKKMEVVEKASEKTSAFEGVLAIIIGVITVLSLAVGIAVGLSGSNILFKISILISVILVLFGIFLLYLANESTEQAPLTVDKNNTVRMVSVLRRTGKKRTRLLFGGWGNIVLGILVFALALFVVPDSPILATPTPTQTPTATNTVTIIPAPTLTPTHSVTATSTALLSKTPTIGSTKTPVQVTPTP